MHEELHVIVEAGLIRGGEGQHHHAHVHVQWDRLRLCSLVIPEIQPRILPLDQGCQLMLKKIPQKLQILIKKNPLKIFASKSPKIPQKYIKFPKNAANSPQYMCISCDK
jgi:hypothetical protein